MYLDINKYLLVLIGWLIRTSYQLECLQCLSSIKRVSGSWDHSCLDGTLKSLPCPKPVNETTAVSQQCVSALYRVGQRGIGGVTINRYCASTSGFQHDCDPPASLIDFDRSESFYCRYTCSDDGCNRHLVGEITANSSQLLKTNRNLYYYIAFIFFYYLIFDSRDREFN